MTPQEPDPVRALYAGVERLMDTLDTGGRKIGNCVHGVYLFRDYDGEPIYVGQTRESLRTRIRRHLTNQRTDAVAMRVLDPFEVAEIEIWPFWDLEKRPPEEVRDTLNRAEFTVYQQATDASAFGTLLNETEISPTAPIDLPPSMRSTILPETERKNREHPDIRLARRARTIAELARIISERRIRIGIRRTLWAQAQRLEHLARERLEQIECGRKKP